MRAIGRARTPIQTGPCDTGANQTGGAVVLIVRSDALTTSTKTK